MSDFNKLKQQVADKFAKMVATGQTLFTVAYDRDLIWQAYINSFQDPGEKQGHNCSACRSFIRQAGAVVIINADNTRSTLWDIADVPSEFSDGVKALAAYVKSAPIAGRFYHEQPSVGVDKNRDPKNNTTWEHFFVKLPAEYYDKEKAGPTKNSVLVGAHGTFTRALTEIKSDAVDTVLELIGQNSLYRGNEFKHIIEQLKALQKEYAKLKPELRDDFVWRQVVSQHGSISGVRNSAIGTLLVNLSEDMDLEGAVRAYETITAPTNYRRPTALVTPRMVEEAKKKLTDLGLISALDRRKLDSRDIKPDNTVFVYRPKADNKDVFAEISGNAPVDMKKLERVEAISIADFVKNVLPTANVVRVLLERKHLGNLATLTGPVDAEAKPLFKWDNSFGWSYTGGVADSIKEKVKAAGGKVDGVWMRASLAWSNYDDLDLHFHNGRGGQGGWGATRSSVGFYNKRDHARDIHLDVDMNAGGGHTRTPVENIYFGKKLVEGTYNIQIHNYCGRERTNVGYDVEIEVNGEVFNFSSKTNVENRIIFNVDASGNVTFENNTLSKNGTSAVKWGLSTGVWQTVTTVMVSPNHWTKPVGNKHWFFILKGATSDEATRPFYNEFLCEELAKERKVMEVLGSKVKVADAEGAELSGLGFSETVRNEVYVEVEGKFKRTLKVIF